MKDHWRVGAIMREPEPVVQRFVDWYRRLGAQTITIFLDDPDDPVRMVLAGQSDLEVIPCTPDFWQTLGLENEARFAKRQNAALTWLYRRHDTGWLLNVDADELLWPGQGGVAGLIARAKPDDVSVRVETAEYILSEVDDPEVLFRLPMSREARQKVYGDDNALFGPRRMGMVGHRFGKSLIRCGVTNAILKQHWPQGVRGKGFPSHVVTSEEGAYLLHMMAHDFAQWREKMEWRSRSSGFPDTLNNRIDEALASAKPELELQDLFRRLHFVTSERAALMQSEGVLLSLSDQGLVLREMRPTQEVVTS